jgi:nucleoid DNA-binding protein
MTKRRLIEIVAKKTNLTKKIAREVITSFLEEISKSLIKGEKAVISGFGTFKVVKVKVKKGRVIKTGQEVTIPAHRAAKFTASKTLKRAVK